MAWSSFAKQQAYYRAYAQTPQGQAARQRARQRWLAKRKAGQSSRVNPAPLAHALNSWSRT